MELRTGLLADSTQQQFGRWGAQSDRYRTIGLGIVDHAFQVIEWGVFVCNKGKLATRNTGEIGKVVDFEGQLVTALHQLQVNRCAHAHSDNLSVGFCLGDACEHRDTAGAGLVLNHNIPTGLFFHHFGDDAAHCIGRATGPKTDLQHQRPAGGPILRVGYS